MRTIQLVLAVLVTLAPSFAANAQLTVFQHPTNPGTPGAPPATVSVGGPAVALNLWYQTGSTPSSAGTACLSGSGNEVCGWDFHVSTSSPSVVLQSFTPDSGLGSDIVANISGNVLRANGGNPISGELGAHRIGTLFIAASAPGSVTVSGNMIVTASLLGVAPTTGNTIANAVTGGDIDLDGVPDATDNCPSVANGAAQAGTPGVGNQSDNDTDGAGDACDNCVFTANPRVNLALLSDCTNAGLCWATLTGSQRDDDHDGYGNKCDGDFTPTALNVGTGDLQQYNASSGKSRLTDTCGTSG